MNGKRSNRAAAQLEYLREWCLALTRAMAELRTPSPFDAMMEQAINAGFRRGALRGLREVARDLFEASHGLSPTQWEKVDARLRAQFGRGLTDEAEALAKAIGRIVKAGRIANEEECRLVMGRIEEIYAHKSKRKEIEELDKLLEAYRTRRRG